MPSCSIPSCKNNSNNCKGTGIKFHRLSKNPQVLSGWKNACNKEINLEAARICSVHFKKSCYVRKPDHLIVEGDTDIYILDKNAVPTENVSINSLSSNRKRRGSHSHLPDNHVAYKKPKNTEKEKQLSTLDGNTSLSNEILISLRSSSPNTLDAKVLCNSKIVNISRNCTGTPKSSVPLMSVSVCSDNNATAAGLMSASDGNSRLDISRHNLEVIKLDEVESIQSFFLLTSADSTYNFNNQKQSEQTDDDSISLNTISNAYSRISNAEIDSDKLRLSKEVELLRNEAACLNLLNEKLLNNSESQETENNILKNENKILNEENKKLKTQVEKLTKEQHKEEKKQEQKVREKVYEILSPIFTRGQIHRLLHPGKTRTKWDSDDIASAIALKSVSPKGYRYLHKKNYPLPGLSTLRKRAANTKMNPGILSEVIAVMAKKGESEPIQHRICCFSLDEIHISQKIEIERTEDKKVGPHKAVQLGLVRGLFKKWKQPVFYDYDQSLTENIVKESIGKLYDAGYIVVAATSDLAHSNVSIWNKLNVAHDKNCYFPHPRDPNLRVYVFADPPHLLTLIRNNFIDFGFPCNNVTLNKDCLEEILKLNKNGLRIPHKLEHKHLDCAGTERQKVLLAAQLLSHTTAQAIEWFGRSDFLQSNNWSEVADFFELSDKWFDVFNSKSKNYKTRAGSAYGVHLEEQNEILNDMSACIGNMRVGNHNSLLSFQKGILLNNRSLPGLLYYLQDLYSSESFQISYILTNRLNQDGIEHFFSYIRGMGAGNDKPSALEFRYRIRWYVLGKHCTDMFVQNANTQEDEDSTLADVVDYNADDSIVNTDEAEREAMRDVMELENIQDELLDFQYEEGNNYQEIDFVNETDVEIKVDEDLCGEDHDSKNEIHLEENADVEDNDVFDDNIVFKK